MSWKTRISTIVLTAGALALTFPVQGAQQAGGRGGRGGVAGGRGGAPAGRGAAPIARREIKPGLFMITGAGANTMVRVTPDGLIVVDTKLDGEANFNSLMEQIKSISDRPVKYVLNTQHHPDHTGNNQRFIDAGATVIALEALKSFMASDPRTTSIPGRPQQTFAKDNVVKLGGVSVEQHFYGRGHTGDDTMTYFPDLKVIMVSDDVTDRSPVIDWANGGSWVEWSKALESVLKLDFEVAIPGAGEPRGKAEIQAFKTKVDTVISRTNEAIRKGATTGEQLAMQVKSDDLAPWNLDATFFNNLYGELTKAK
ncbi:MAG TPA: MBL fold metallo-hydrolase [Terriglobia bacterium]|nr:MBL fold metallo-hydrolase [Terriglobia bacterium]